MGNRIRKALKVTGAIFAALVGLVAFVLITKNPLGIGVGRGVQKAETCRECHPQQHREWSDGQAAAFVAMREPFLVGQATEFAGWACWKCHDPFKLGLDEGVTCEYCHGQSKAGLGEAGCGEERRARILLLRDEEFCHRCHSVVHPITRTDFQGTVGEWKRSRAGREGVTCQGCHMPLIGEGEDRHHFHGHYYPGRNPLPGREAVSITGILKEGDQISVFVKNHCQGHCMPTGAFTKAMLLEVKGFDQSSTDPVFEDEFLFLRRFKFREVLGIQRFPWQLTVDTRLGPEEERRVTFDLGEFIGVSTVIATIRFAFVGDKGFEPRFFTSDFIARKEVTF